MDEDMDNGSMEQPLQLIRFEFEQQRDDFEKRLKVTLDSDVLDTVMKTCKDRKLCAITVTGNAQSGKGFLFNAIKEGLMAAEKGTKLDETNWLVNKNISDFHHDNGNKQVTKGIWIWNRAFMIKGEADDDEEIAVLLLETQGFHEKFTKLDEMLATLGISVLTSSVLMLDFPEDLPTIAFDWLETFCELGIKLIKKGFQQPFQNLSFFIRELASLSEYSSYGKFSGKEMFEKMIHKVRGNVGTNLEKCFEEVDCFLMPHFGGQALQQASEGNPADLDKDFSRRLHAYVVRGLCDPENLRVKKILDNPLTAGEWKEFLISYVALFNGKSETAWSLQAESIWWFTKETTGKIKIDRALAAYQQVYHQRMEDHVGGYISERSIEGLHIQANSKASAAFADMVMPEEEESYFKGKLQQLLEEEKEKIKQENKKTRSSTLAGCCLLSNAVCKIKSGLKTLLPFKSEDGSDVSSEFIFYEDSFFYQAFNETMESIQQEFLETFQDGGDLEELNKLKEALSSVLYPIVEKYTDKNIENRMRTINKAQMETEKLKKDYKSEMNALVQNDPEVSVKTLRFYHDKQVKTLMANFKQLNIGSAAFQQQWLDNTLEKFEDQYERLKGSLDSTANKAMKIARKDSLNSVLQPIVEEYADNNIEDGMSITDIEKEATENLKEDLKIGNVPFQQNEKMFRDSLESTDKNTLEKEKLHQFITLVKPDDKDLTTRKEQKQSIIIVEDDILKRFLAPVGDRRLCILAICGLCRQWKSLMSGYIIAQLEALERGEPSCDNWIGWVADFPFNFDFDHGCLPDGISACERPFILKRDEHDGEEMAVILLDVHTSQDTNMLVELALLCSSTTLLVLNDISSPPRDIIDSIDTLKTYIDFEKYIKKSDGGTVSSQNQDQRLFQDLVILFENRKCSEEYPYAEEQLLLEKQLNVMENDTKIRDLFTNLSYFPMPHIGEEFAQEVKVFLTDRLAPSKLTAKSMFGVPITATQFIKMMCTYVKLFNLEKARIDSMPFWDATILVNNEFVVERCLQTYKDNMELHALGLEYISDTQMEKAQSVAVEQAFQRFTKEVRCGKERGGVIQLWDLLAEKIHQLSGNYTGSEQAKKQFAENNEFCNLKECEKK